MLLTQRRCWIPNKVVKRTNKTKKANYQKRGVLKLLTKWPKLLRTFRWYHFWSVSKKNYRSIKFKTLQQMCVVLIVWQPHYNTFQQNSHNMHETIHSEQEWTPIPCQHAYTLNNSKQKLEKKRIKESSLLYGIARKCSSKNIDIIYASYDCKLMLNDLKFYYLISAE